MLTAHAKVKIAIVDDHTLFRNGIASLLKEFDQLDLTFEAENGEAMVKQITKGNIPEVVLMDINMPVMDGFTATRWLTDQHPGINVLALTTYEDDHSVIKMIRAGANGYILKRSRPRELLEAIVTIHEKGIFFNEMLSPKLLRLISSADTDPSVSEKELVFLRLCCSELTYKEIADKMFVSPRTIDNYRESLFLKFNIKSRTGLVLFAVKQGHIEIRRV